MATILKRDIFHAAQAFCFIKKIHFYIILCINGAKEQWMENWLIQKKSIIIYKKKIYERILDSTLRFNWWIQKSHLILETECTSKRFMFNKLIDV